jgi:hypothetical protein
MLMAPDAAAGGSTRLTLHLTRAPELTAVVAADEDRGG